MEWEEKLKEYSEEVKGLFETYKKTNDEALEDIKTGMSTSAVTQEKLDKIELDMQSCEKKMDEAVKHIEDEKKAREAAEEKIKDLEAKLNRPHGDGELQLERKDFIVDGLYEQAKMPEWQEYSKKFWDWIRTEAPPGGSKTLTFRDPETGGYLGPPEYVNEIIKELREITPAIQLATLRTTSANQMNFPKKTGTVTAKRRGESQTKTATEGLKYGMETVTLPEMYTYADVTEMDLEDTMFNLEQELREEFTDAQNYLVGYEFIWGEGPLELEGLLTNADVAQQLSGVASSLGADTLIDLVEAGLKAQYRMNSRLMFNALTLAKLRQMKYAVSGEYIWSPDYSAGGDNTILGRPYTISEDMPDVADNAFPIIYADFKKGYRIGLRVSMTFKRIIDSALDEVGAVRFSSRMRIGGRVVQANAVKKYKITPAG